MKLKDFFPPVITDFMKKNQKVTTYKTYEEASAYCPQEAYQNEELCNVIADKTLVHIELLKTSPFKFNPTTVYLAFALNYFANATRKQNITVLDFGGACGAHYYEVRSIIPPLVSLKWVVVETEQMIRSAASRGLAKGEVCFVARIEDCKDEVDFVHSSSALQYVPSPYSFLEKLIQVKAKMMLFNRMMFNKNDYDIITVQKSLLSSNGPGKLPAGYVDRQVRYPHTTMSNEKMKSIMTAGNYKGISEFSEASGKFSLGREEIIGNGTLFVDKHFLNAKLGL